MNTENFDALKRHESTEVDRRTWLHVPSGTLWSTSSDTHQVVEVWCVYYKRKQLVENISWNISRKSKSSKFISTAFANGIIRRSWTVLDSVVNVHMFVISRTFIVGVVSKTREVSWFRSCDTRLARLHVAKLTTHQFVFFLRFFSILWPNCSLWRAQHSFFRVFLKYYYIIAMDKATTSISYPPFVHVP